MLGNIATICFSLKNKGDVSPNGGKGIPENKPFEGPLINITQIISLQFIFTETIFPILIKFIVIPPKTHFIILLYHFLNIFDMYMVKISIFLRCKFGC